MGKDLQIMHLIEKKKIIINIKFSFVFIYFKKRAQKLFLLLKKKKELQDYVAFKKLIFFANKCIYM